MGSTLVRALGRRYDKDVVLVDKDGKVIERPSHLPPVKREKRPEVKAAPSKGVGDDAALGRRRR
jgi:hypothetical protein